MRSNGFLMTFSAFALLTISLSAAAQTPAAPAKKTEIKFSVERSSAESPKAEAKAAEATKTKPELAKAKPAVEKKKPAPKAKPALPKKAAKEPIQLLPAKKLSDLHPDNSAIKPATLELTPPANANAVAAPAVNSAAVPPAEASVHGATATLAESAKPVEKVEKAEKKVEPVKAEATPLKDALKSEPVAASAAIVATAAPEASPKPLAAADTLPVAASASAGAVASGDSAKAGAAASAASDSAKATAVASGVDAKSVAIAKTSSSESALVVTTVKNAVSLPKMNWFNLHVGFMNSSWNKIHPNLKKGSVRWGASVTREIVPNFEAGLGYRVFNRKPLSQGVEDIQKGEELVATGRYRLGEGVISFVGGLDLSLGRYQAWSLSSTGPGAKATYITAGSGALPGIEPSIGASARVGETLRADIGFGYQIYLGSQAAKVGGLTATGTVGFGF